MCSTVNYYSLKLEKHKRLASFLVSLKVSLSHCHNYENVHNSYDNAWVDIQSIEDDQFVLGKSNVVTCVLS